VLTVGAADGGGHPSVGRERGEPCAVVRAGPGGAGREAGRLEVKAPRFRKYGKLSNAQSG